jgi:hypothetical protein
MESATRRLTRQTARQEIRLTLLLLEADQTALLLKESRRQLESLRQQRVETLDSLQFRMQEVLGTPVTPPSSTTTGRLPSQGSRPGRPRS